MKMAKKNLITFEAALIKVDRYHFKRVNKVVRSYNGVLNKTWRVIYRLQQRIANIDAAQNRRIAKLEAAYKRGK
jgi:hypothetical protein